MKKIFCDFCDEEIKKKIDWNKLTLQTVQPKLVIGGKKKLTLKPSLYKQSDPQDLCWRCAVEIAEWIRLYKELRKTTKTNLGMHKITFVCKKCKTLQTQKPDEIKRDRIESNNFEYWFTCSKCSVIIVLTYIEYLKSIIDTTILFTKRRFTGNLY